jgi:hypothetical protein
MLHRTFDPPFEPVFPFQRGNARIDLRGELWVLSGFADERGKSAQRPLYRP